MEEKRYNIDNFLDKEGNFIYQEVNNDCWELDVTRHIIHRNATINKQDPKDFTHEEKRKITKAVVKWRDEKTHDTFLTKQMKAEFSQLSYTSDDLNYGYRMNLNISAGTTNVYIVLLYKLMSYDPLIIHRTGKDGNTPLQLFMTKAMHSNHYLQTSFKDIINTLIDMGAYCNFVNEDGSLFNVVYELNLSKKLKFQMVLNLLFQEDSLKDIEMYMGVRSLRHVLDPYGRHDKEEDKQYENSFLHYTYWILEVLLSFIPISIKNYFRFAKDEDKKTYFHSIFSNVFTEKKSLFCRYLERRDSKKDEYHVKNYEISKNVIDNILNLIKQLETTEEVSKIENQEGLFKYLAQYSLKNLNYEDEPLTLLDLLVNTPRIYTNAHKCFMRFVIEKLYIYSSEEEKVRFPDIEELIQRAEDSSNHISSIQK